MANKNLDAAKAEKNDEFYTRMNDVSDELYRYRNHFVGKKIFLNCDDPQTSNFWKYFELNFDELQLKKLTSTHYDAEEPTYKLEMTRGVDVNGDGVMDGHDIVQTPLIGNGDFRSAECIELLKEADIVITNPPFSLWREYITQLIDHDKKFIILGSQNATSYKEVFPLIKDNQLWLGFNFGAMSFVVPDSYEKGKIDIGSDGKRYAKLGNIAWYTNLDIDKRHAKLTLWKDYEENKEDYPRYDNYDAINVDKVSEIPRDYYGVMGVPITFLNDYSPDQFKIIGIAKAGAGDSSLKTKEYPRQTQIDKHGNVKENVSKLNDGPAIKVEQPPSGKTYYRIGNDIYIQTYARVLIQRVDQPEEPQEGGDE